jgi:hypothetical protein
MLLSFMLAASHKFTHTLEREIGSKAASFVVCACFSCLLIIFLLYYYYYYGLSLSHVSKGVYLILTAFFALPILAFA